jgi:hypothetical protein
MIRSKAAFLASVALLMVRCGAGAGENTAYNSSGFDTNKDEAARADERDTARNAVGSDAHSICPWVAYAAQHRIPETTTRLVEHGELDLNGRYGEPLELLDSMLHGASLESRAFYMWVVTRSMAKADGYYAEGLGNLSRDFAEQRTAEWATNLSDTVCYTEKDQHEWARTIAGELLIVDEHADQHELDTCIARLNKGCDHCPTMQRDWLHRFSGILRAEHQQMLDASK